MCYSLWINNSATLYRLGSSFVRAARSRAASAGSWVWSMAAIRSRTVSKTHPAGIQHSSSVTSNVPAILASSWATPLEHEASAFGGTQTPQIHEDGAALRG